MTKMGAVAFFIAVLLVGSAAASSRTLLDNNNKNNGKHNVITITDDVCPNGVGMVNVLGSNVNSGAGVPAQLHLEGKHCTHFYKGFDVTGVVTEFDLTNNNTLNGVPNDAIHNACDCVRACFERIGVCMAWVWKFTGVTNARTCTLYSQFNLPPLVTLTYNVAASQNGATVTNGAITPGNGPSTAGILDNNVHNENEFGHIQVANQVQPGSTIPVCTMNGQPNGTPDPDCRSGMITLFANGHAHC